MKNCTPLWREAHLKVKMYKHPQLLEVEGMKKCTALRCEAHFEVKSVRKLTKSARCCGAKHISKSKAQKTEGYGPLLDVRMSFYVASTRDSAPCQKRVKT